jgi:hypothetical protein
LVPERKAELSFVTCLEWCMYHMAVDLVATVGLHPSDLPQQGLSAVDGMGRLTVRWGSTEEVASAR